jgi:PAS domain S-box-containing protein
MRLCKTNQPRALAPIAIGVLVALLGLFMLMPSMPLGDWLVRCSYDSLHILGAEDPPAHSPVVIVYLDLQSYANAHQDPAHPWPRELHARLLNRLRWAGAKAVVFDIVFSAAGPDTAADDALTQAIRDQGSVVLAAEYSDQASHVTRQDAAGARLGRLEPPFEPFARAAAAWGIAEQRMDDDFVVRHYLAGFPSPPRPSLTWAAASLLDRPPAPGTAAMEAANENWIRYYGPSLTIPHVGYTEALDPAGGPEDFFRGKVVFVGARPVIEAFNQRQDEFRNPFHSWRHKELFMPGVEVHATEMLNLMRGDWLRRLSGTKEAWLLILCGLAFGGGLLWLRPIPASLAAVAGAGLVLLAALRGFAGGIWFPWLIVSALQIPCALGGSVLFHSLEWLRARRRFEAAKRVDEARIREQAALLDKAHDAILVQDLGGKILYANAGAENLYGWSLAQLQSDPAPSGTELFTADSAAAAAARAAALARGEWNGELRQQTRDGRIITVDSRWTLIRDDIGQPKALLLISTDITERKQLEAQFLRTQRMNTIGSMAGGMAHDLNNALAPILLGVQLLRRKSADEETIRLLAMMETSTHRGADMVRQVLLFARGRGGEFERLELGPIVKELEKMVRETFPKNIAVESFLPRDLWPVRGNPTQLHQVLLNLCVNARDAMPNGGRLSFAADNVELTAQEAARIPEAAAGQYVSLLVSDTGTGIPPEVQARIFEPFFTTKGEGRGTGIGLATVLRIVKSHGGFMRLDSEPGQGTTFELFLPRAGDVDRATAKTPAAELPRGRGELILIVDDERAFRELVADGLAAQGYRALTAAGGEDGLQQFKEHAAEVRLVITDGAMPGMDGPQLIRELRKLKPALPLIIASGDARPDQVEPASDVVVLTKPVSLEEILGAVQQLVSNESPARSKPR